MSQSFYGSFYVTNFVKPHKYFEKYLFLIPDTCHAILRCKPVYGFALRESLLSQIFKISVNHFRTSSILLDSTQPLILDFYHTTALLNITNCPPLLVSLALLSLIFHAVVPSIQSQKPVTEKAFLYLFFIKSIPINLIPQCCHPTER